MGQSSMGTSSNSIGDFSGAFSGAYPIYGDATISTNGGSHRGFSWNVDGILIQ
jgi:hypothetical protein